MQVWITEQNAIVQCGFHEKEFVKAIGDYRFDKQSKCWLFPLRKIIDIIDNLNIKYSDETKEVYNRIRNERAKHHVRINEANKIKSSEFKKDDKNPLYKHQQQAVKLGEMFGSYALFCETGTGKTAIAIKLIEHFLIPPMKAMVVAPLSTLEAVWVNEINKWSKLKQIILWNNIDGIYSKYHNVCLINYEQFKKLHNNGVNIPELISILIIEESSKMKNPKSDTTKSILHYRDKIPHRFCLSGTPAPNNLLEYWGQMAFINDELLSDNFYKFRNNFFRSGGYGGYSYFPIRGAKEAIMALVSNQAFSIRKTDCLDLPERIFEERTVYMDDIQQKAYDDMKILNLLEFENEVILTPNQLSKIMKLRQITSGFCMNKDGIPILISKSKLDVLKELLEEIPEDKQVIIWCQFHYEIERIKDEYKNECVTLYGQLSQREKNDNISTFLAGKKRLLIGHPKTGGLGLNFQKNCSYMVWYSLSYSQEEYSQACDRVYRSGQQNICTYFLLLAHKSIDEIIYKALQGKADLMNDCLNMLKKGV